MASNKEKNRNLILGKVSVDVSIGSNTQIGESVTIEKGTQIGSNTVIDGEVSIGKDNIIGSNTVIHGPTQIGDKNFISDLCSIGVVSQHSIERYEISDKYNYTGKKIIIGNFNVIREFSTIHLPMVSRTEIKNNCYLMDYNHVSHDTVLHEGVILANNTQIGGHTSLLPYANIGLSTTIHQRSTIGSFTMIGMGSIIASDILPFVIALGTPAKPKKLNIRGFERNNFSEDQITKIKSFFSSLKDEKYIEEINIENIDISIVENSFKEFFKTRKENRKIASLSELKV